MDIEYELQGDNKVVLHKRDFEDMMNIITYDIAKSRTEELFPAAFTTQLIDGENPLRAFRKYRGFSQAALSEASGVAQGLISEIENGRKMGSIQSLKALARTLDVEIDDLL